MKKTGDNIKSVIIQKFDLGERFQSLIYVTDREPNMIAALKNNVRISCTAHILNNVLEKTMDRLVGWMDGWILMAQNPFGTCCAKTKLTDNFINKLQNYYGIAIRANAGNLLK